MRFERITVDPKVCTGKALHSRAAVSGLAPARSPGFRRNQGRHLEGLPLSWASRYWRRSQIRRLARRGRNCRTGAV